MNEVKRYDLTIEELGSSEDGYLEQFIESSDGEYVKLSDFKSERALRKEAETKLHELQDAIEMSLSNHEPLKPNNRFESENIFIQSTWGEEGFDLMKNAIQESRKRKK